MQIREALPEDLSTIMAIEVASFPRDAWSPQSWGEEIDHHHVAVACEGADVAGVISVSAVEGEAELRSIAVTPGNRNKGIGASLLHYGMDWAKQAGATQMFLEVSMANFDAKRLYIAFDFEDVAVRKDYYGPGDHALIMRRSLD